MLIGDQEKSLALYFISKLNLEGKMESFACLDSGIFKSKNFRSFVILLFFEPVTLKCMY